MQAEPGPGQYLIIAFFWEWTGVLERKNERTVCFIVQGEGLEHAEDTAEAALHDVAFLGQLFHTANHPVVRHAELVAKANDPAYHTDSNHPLRRRRCWAIDTVLPLHRQPVYQPPASVRPAR